MAKKLSYKEVKKGFEIKNLILLEDEYINSQTPMKYRCIAHPERELTITWNRLQSGSSLCRLCEIEDNNLWVKFPDIANLLKNKKRGYELTPYSHEHEIFVCENCGHENNMQISRATTRGFKCQSCSDGISYPEKFMTNLLDQLNFNYDKQKTFKWSKNKRYDFYIPSLNCIIETHGLQHYTTSFMTISSRTLKEEQENDILKETLAVENNIDHYIIIDCSLSEMGYIKQSILNSNLNSLLNLKNVNWMKCHKFSCGTMVKVICNFWNKENKSTYEISKIFKSSPATIIKYLKQGTLLGWCDYNPIESYEKSHAQNYAKRRKKVLQFTKDNKLIKEWDSIREASNGLKIDETSISKVCKGDYKTAGGFRWILKESYSEYCKEVI